MSRLTFTRGVRQTCSDSLYRASARLSRRVFVVMRALASLWEKHGGILLGREEQVQRRLDELRLAQEQHVQVSATTIRDRDGDRDRDCDRDDPKRGRRCSWTSC